MNTSPIWNTRLYTGREYDTETGLAYHRARYYDPGMGRFLSPDPIWTADDINLYRYVANSPVMYTDRNGKEKRSLAKKYDVTDLVLDIFDLAMEDTKDNWISFISNTAWRWAYDLKRYGSISAMAKKNNGIAYFNWEAIEPSNLWNLLAGFNMENSDLPNWFAKSWFRVVEVINAQHENYSFVNSIRVANADEYTDAIWYSAWIRIHQPFISADRDTRKSLITSAISNSTEVYNARKRLESEIRKNLH